MGSEQITTADAVIDWLNGMELGVIAYPTVPADRPDAFVTVSRVGGRIECLVLDHASIEIDCWGPDAGSAQDLAREVGLLVGEMTGGIQNCFGASVSSIYDNPDPDSGQPRVTVSAAVDYNM